MHKFLAFLIALPLFMVAAIPAQAQTECYVLRGSASDYTATRTAAGSLVLRSPKYGVEVVSGNCLRFEADTYRYENGKIVPNFSTGGTPTSNPQADYDRGWNAAVAAVVVPARR